MVFKHPNGYSTLEKAEGGRTGLSVMGVVTGLMEPTPCTASHQQDWMITFDLSDGSMGASSRLVRYFHQPGMLPKCKIGDVILLRGVRHEVRNYVSLLLAIKTATWAVFDGTMLEKMDVSDSSYQLSLNSPGPPTKHEKEAVLAMHRAFLACELAGDVTIIISKPTANSGTTASASREKFALIQDLESWKFYDLVGQVVKVFLHNRVTELSITDYTSNDGLENHGDPAAGRGSVGRDGDMYGYADRSYNNWKGPLGRRTLVVSLWPPHNQVHVPDNSFVFLSNVKIKPHSRHGYLEGAIHSDSTTAVAIIQARDDEQVKNLLRRKMAYEKQFGPIDTTTTTQKRPIFSETAAAEVPSAEADKKASRTAKRRRQDGQRAAKKAPKANPAIAIATNSNNAPNPHIVCNFHTTPVRSLSVIQAPHPYTTPPPSRIACSLPFHNVCSRASVRVVDFFPPDLAAFSIRHHSSEYDVLSDVEIPSSSSSSSSSSSAAASQEGDKHEHASSAAASARTSTKTTKTKTKAAKTAVTGQVGWEWRFALLLEDATVLVVPPAQRERMIAFVVLKDADCLLTLDAVDLRRDAQALAVLREKLFLLWGDLEERKRAAGGKVDGRSGSGGGGGRPFVCCVKEFGIRKEDRWKRMWRVFGTSINS